MTKTYTVVVTRATDDTSLRALVPCCSMPVNSSSVVGGNTTVTLLPAPNTLTPASSFHTLTPGFDAGHLLYDLRVGGDTASTTLMPIKNHSWAVIMVNGAFVPNGTYSQPIALAEGQVTPVLIRVVAHNSSRHLYARRRDRCGS